MPRALETLPHYPLINPLKSHYLHFTNGKVKLREVSHLQRLRKHHNVGYQKPSGFPPASQVGLQEEEDNSSDTQQTLWLLCLAYTIIPEPGDSPQTRKRSPVCYKQGKLRLSRTRNRMRTIP